MIACERVTIEPAVEASEQRAKHTNALSPPTSQLEFPRFRRQISVADFENPSITGGLPAEVDPGTTLYPRAEDGGVGVARLRMSSPNDPNWQKEWAPNCLGNTRWRCPTPYTESVVVGGLRPGRSTLRVQAWDKVNNYSYRDYSVVNYVTSWQYGGDDRRVNTIQEAVAASAAIADSETPEQVFEGLYLADREFVCRGDIPDEGYPSGCSDEALDENATPPPPEELDGDVSLLETGGGTTASSSSTRSVPYPQPPANNVRTIMPSGGPWATVRNRGGHYAIGNATNNDRLVTGGRKGAWYVGRVEGDYGGYRLGCGWVKSSNTVPTDERSATGCTTSSWPRVPKFARRINCRNCGQTSGKFKPLPGTALCANLSSLFNRSGKTCTKTIDPDISDRLIGWRYITRDGGWVMITISGLANSQGKWGFVRRSDIPDSKITRTYAP